MKTILMKNTKYFTDGKHLYYERIYFNYAGKIRKVKFNEVKRVDGIYLKRHQKILTLLTNKNSCSKVKILERTICS